MEDDNVKEVLLGVDLNIKADGGYNSYVNSKLAENFLNPCIKEIMLKQQIDGVIRAVYCK